MNEEHPNLVAALVAALGGLSVVEKGRTATVPMKSGGKYSYDYADLGDVVKLTRPVLAEHGLVALTPIEEHGDGLKCTVVLLHSSGERMDFGPFPFPHGHDAQATGSSVTYYRRYALVSALGMAAGDDDDGATAAPAQAQRQRTQAPSQGLQGVAKDVGPLMNDAPPATNDNLAAAAIIKNLTPDKLAVCKEWWTNCEFPFMSSGAPNPLRLAGDDLAAVFEFLRELDAADGPQAGGDGTASVVRARPDEGAETPAVPQSTPAEPAGAPVVEKSDEEENLDYFAERGMLSPEEEDKVRTGGGPHTARAVMNAAKAKK